MTLNKNTIKQVTRAYNRVTSAKDDEKREAARSALEALCRKFSIDLAEYIEDLPEGLHFDFSKEEQAAPAKEPVETPAKTKAEVKKESKPKAPSRRGMIIELVQEGTWDIKTLAEHLHNVNPKWAVDANRRAISGTLSDMKRNHNWIVENKEDGKLCIRIES